MYNLLVELRLTKNLVKLHIKRQTRRKIETLIDIIVKRRAKTFPIRHTIGDIQKFQLLISNSSSVRIAQIANSHILGKSEQDGQQSGPIHVIHLLIKSIKLNKSVQNVRHRTNIGFNQ